MAENAVLERRDEDYLDEGIVERMSPTTGDR
jgi:hypothetical protein